MCSLTSFSLAETEKYGGNVECGEPGKWKSENVEKRGVENETD